MTFNTQVDFSGLDIGLQFPRLLLLPLFCRGLSLVDKKIEYQGREKYKGALHA